LLPGDHLDGEATARDSRRKPLVLIEPSGKTISA